MEVSLKVQIVRMGGDVVQNRRIRLCSPTFDVVKRVVGEWVPGDFFVRYTDDEGDLVTMDTDEEWAECLKVCKAFPVIKLQVTKKHNKRCHMKEPCIEASVYKSGKGKKCLNCNCTTTGIIPDYCCKKCMHGKGHGHRCRELPHEQEADSSIKDKQDVVSAYLEQHHGSDVLGRLYTFQLTPEELNYDWLTVRPVGDDVELDVTMNDFSQHLMKEGLRLMDAPDFKAALACFEKCARIGVTVAIAYYNCACCEALLGNQQAAVDFLRKATENGYTDFELIKNDDDLVSLRGLPEFLEILEGGHTAKNESTAKKKKKAKKNTSTCCKRSLKHNGAKHAKSCVASRPSEQAETQTTQEVPQLTETMVYLDIPPEVPEPPAPMETVTEPEPAVEHTEVIPLYDAQVKTLTDLGLFAGDETMRLLEQHNGDIRAVIDALLS